MIAKTLAVLLVCLTIVAAYPLTSLSGQLDTAGGSPYVIQPNDVLTIFIFNHPELSLEVTVQPDGRMSIPLVQSIQASGLSPEDLKPKIEEKLADKLDVPDVTVIVKAIRSYSVFVIGKVQKPGQLSYEKPITILQALTLAGGFQDYAKKNEITIVRTTPAKGTSTQQETQFKFNYDDVVKGADPLQNRFLVSGDVVIVP